MKALLARALSIRPDEARRVGLFFAFFAGIGMFYTVGATVGDTLFLANLPSARVPRLLPWVYVGVAVINVMATLLFDAVQAKVSRAASILGTQLLLALSVVAARQLVEGGTTSVYFGLAVWLEVCALLSVTLFFSFAGDYFRPRDARRLYGFIAGGMAVGTVVSGWSIHLLVPLIGTTNLIYVCSALLGFNTVVAAVILRIERPAPIDEAAPGEAEGGRVALRTIFTRPYMRQLALIVPLSIVVSVLVDYQMKWIASTLSEARLARFFGSLYGWVGVAQILFQFLLVPRLLQRLGIIRCLMILPLGLLLGSALLGTGALFAFWGLSMLWFSAGVNFLRMTLSETLDLPSRELLFLPLPTRLRVRAQPLMSGALAPAAQGLGGLCMLATLWLGFGVEALSLLAVLLTTTLLLVLLRLRPLYRQTLAATLREHQLDPTDLERLLASPNVEPVFEDLLRSADRDVVQSTLALLDDRSLGSLGATLADLVESPDAEIAVAALERLAAEGGHAATEAIRRAWGSNQRLVRQAAVLALCRAAPDDAVEPVSRTLEDEDPHMRASAIIGLAKHCGADGRALAHPRLAALACSAEGAERLEAARLLGRINKHGQAELLRALASDHDQGVRVAAVEACAQLGDPALMGTLLEALGKPELRAAAMRALGAMPPEAAAPLLQILDDGATPVAERCAIARVLARVGGPTVIAALWRACDDDRDLLLRIASAEALGTVLVAAPATADGLDNMEARVEALCGQIQLLAQARLEIADDVYVRSILLDHGKMYAELLLSMLCLGFDRPTLERIRHNYFEEPRDAALRALELFEELLPRRLARLVAGALQAWLGPATAEPPGGLARETIAALLASDPWVRVATIHHRNQGAAYPTVDASAMDDGDRKLYRSLEVVRFLKRVPLFRDLPAYLLLDQAEIAEWHSAADAAVLVEQGEEGEALYILCRGEVRIVVDGREVARLGEGECIGDLSLIDGEPRNATAIAAGEVVLLRIEASRFRNLLVTQPAVARGLLRTLDRRIRETQGDRPAGSAPPPGMRRSQFMRAQPLGLQQLVSTMSFLRQVELFRDLPTAAMANLAGIAQEVLLYEGDTLFEEGDVGESFYLVCSGEIAIEVGEHEVARLGKNACLGEMALISGLPRSASATATSEGRLLRIGSDELAALLAGEPDIALSLLRTLARRLRGATQKRMQRSLEPGPA